MRAITPILLLFAVACGSPPAPVPAPAPVPVPVPDQAPALAGAVTVKHGATPKGTLVLGWRTAADQNDLEAHTLTIWALRRLIDTLVPRGEVDFGATKSVAYRIEGAPRDATPVAFVDVEHTFWPTLFGHGPGFAGAGPAGGGDIELESAPPSPAAAEPCTGPRRKLVTIDAPDLPSRRPGPRRFCAWLPKSWSSTSPRRYPLVLLLPGFLSDEMAYFGRGGGMGPRFDESSAHLDREAVVIGVDTSTPFGSTYLEDSRGQGAWDTFLIKRALPVLERELHTIPKASARALAGHSTGGYNAISYAMRHSDVFSALGASSPDAPDVEAWLFDSGTRRPRPWIRQWTMLDDALGGPGQITSWAVDWSADASPRGWAWPFDPSTGVVDEGVLARWVAKTPHGLLRDPAFAARVKKDLSTRMYVSVGRDDEFGLFEPAEAFVRELRAMNIEARFIPTATGHGGYEERLERAFEFLLERLDRAIR